jgi:hypothetical protein
VYVRLDKGETIDDIEPETLEDCAQLCKANSIQGTGSVASHPTDVRCSATAFIGRTAGVCRATVSPMTGVEDEDD